MGAHMQCDGVARVPQGLAEQVKFKEATRAAELEAERAPVTLPIRPEDFTPFPLEVTPVATL